jgi:hypothetical protein
MKKFLLLIIIIVNLNYATQIEMVGNWRYFFPTASTYCNPYTFIITTTQNVFIYGGDIVNTDTNNITSGTLELRVYATIGEYNGGTLAGSEFIASEKLGQLNSKYQFSNLSKNLVCNPNFLSGGSTSLVICVCEYTNDSCIVKDYKTFKTQIFATMGRIVENKYTNICPNIVTPPLLPNPGVYSNYVPTCPFTDYNTFNSGNSYTGGNSNNNQYYINKENELIESLKKSKDVSKSLYAPQYDRMIIEAEQRKQQYMGY